MYPHAPSMRAVRVWGGGIRHTSHLRSRTPTRRSLRLPSGPSHLKRRVLSQRAPYGPLWRRHPPTCRPQGRPPPAMLSLRGAPGQSPRPWPERTPWNECGSKTERTRGHQNPAEVKGREVREAALSPLPENATPERWCGIPVASKSTCRVGFRGDITICGINYPSRAVGVARTAHT